MWMCVVQFLSLLGWWRVWIRLTIATILCCDAENSLNSIRNSEQSYREQGKEKNKKMYVANEENRIKCQPNQHKNDIGLKPVSIAHTFVASTKD